MSTSVPAMWYHFTAHCKLTCKYQTWLITRWCFLDWYLMPLYVKKNWYVEGQLKLKKIHMHVLHAQTCLCYLLSETCIKCPNDRSRDSSQKWRNAWVPATALLQRLVPMNELWLAVSYLWSSESDHSAFVGGTWNHSWSNDKRTPNNFERFHCWTGNVFHQQKNRQ